MRAADPDVAIVGAGPAGLAAARWLIARGLEPVLFEAADGVGGQWRATSPASGIWPGMTANTSRVVTRFSDLAYPDSVGMFPHNTEVLAHLEGYAAAFGLDRRLLASSPVQRVEREAGDGWRLTWNDAGGGLRSAVFARAVIASGRFNRPARPDLPGLDGFSGGGGVAHTFGFKRPGRYAGLRVLVAGGAISALEVAADLVASGAARVVVSSRRQRYVIPKLIDGAPADSRFSRYGAAAAETLPAQLNAERTRDWLRRVGDPVRYGAPAPADDGRPPAAAISQDFLPLVAQGRISLRPWISGVEGGAVRFADGAAEPFDAIVLGTGFRLELPFLAEDLVRTLDVDDQHIDLADFTFHPELPGLAFAGLIPQTGPYFPVLELQARYIAYAWSGACPAPEPSALATRVAAARATRGSAQLQAMHAVAIGFARLAGVEPDLRAWPQLARALLFGPLSADSFRLCGPDALEDAPARILADAALHGTAATPRFTPSELALLRELGDASRDPQVQGWAALG